MYIHCENKENSLGTPLTSLNDLSRMNGMYVCMYVCSCRCVCYTDRLAHTHLYIHR